MTEHGSRTAPAPSPFQDPPKYPSHWPRPAHSQPKPYAALPALAQKAPPHHRPLPSAPAIGPRHRPPPSAPAIGTHRRAHPLSSAALAYSRFRLLRSADAHACPCVPARASASACPCGCQCACLHANMPADAMPRARHVPAPCLPSASPLICGRAPAALAYLCAPAALAYLRASALTRGRRRVRASRRCACACARLSVCARVSARARPDCVRLCARYLRAARARPGRAGTTLGRRAAGRASAAPSGRRPRRGLGCAAAHEHEVPAVAARRYSLPLQRMSRYSA